MAQKIKSATDQRKFTLVYNDFLESDILNYYEKMIFIVLKKYTDNETMRAFPSLNTIHKITGISVSQVRRSIEHMKELRVIAVEHRNDDKKGHQSNIYTLFDYAEMWKVGSSSSNTEDVIAIADRLSEAKMIAELRAKGYTVIKEKAPDTLPADQSNNAPSAKINQFDTTDTTSSPSESQEKERYSLEKIKLLYDYRIMIIDYKYKINEIDSVMEILHTTLNTTKKEVRINGEEKPTSVVVSKLLKLTYADIMYAIDKFQEQTSRIENPTAYMLTLLYNAKERMHLDIANQVRYDGVLTIPCRNRN